MPPMRNAERLHVCMKLRMVNEFQVAQHKLQAWRIERRCVANGGCKH